MYCNPELGMSLSIYVCMLFNVDMMYVPKLWLLSKQYAQYLAILCTQIMIIRTSLASLHNTLTLFTMLNACSHTCIITTNCVYTSP